MAFVLAALLLGGAGIASPLAHWFIVMLGLCVLARGISAISWAQLDRGARLVAWVLLASAMLCVLQALPLPQAIWAKLPGHGLAAQIAEAAGGGGWRAWSLSPDRTLDALTALVPIAAGLLIAAQASAEQRREILRLVLIFALLSAALAIIQVAAGPGSAPMLFGSRHRGLGVGFFVNRNHFALFMLFAMLIAALPGIAAPAAKSEDAKATEWAMRVGALALLSLGVLSTLSRAGIFLYPVALASSVLLARQTRLKLPLLFGGVAVASLLALALRAAPPVQAILARYATAAEDLRFQYWSNTLLALRDSMPFGTGLGTFTLVYPTYEPLFEVRPDVVNHAHSDVLELLLEGGLPGLALLIAWLAAVVLLAVRARKAGKSRRERLLPFVVVIATLLTLAASLVDYPVRMNTIAVTLALLVGMLLPVGAVPSTSAVAAPQGGYRRWAWALPLLAVAALVTSSQWGLQLIRSGQQPSAAAIAPWFSPVQSAAATYYQLRAEPEASSRVARRALFVSPLDPAALRAEGMAALALDRREQGARLMSLGALLGWRDGLIQVWLLEQALAAGANDFAIQRIDALMRQDKFGEELLPILPSLLRDEPARAALAEQLSFQPHWRVPFFNQVARDTTWSLPQLLDLTSRLAQARKPATPAETALIRAALANQGRYADVRRVWRAIGQSALIGDGTFDAQPGALPRWAGPYAWYAPALAGVRVDAAQAEITRKGHALAITSDGLAQGVALSQIVALTPGRYALTLAASAEDANALRQVSVALGCRFDENDPRTFPITVPLSWSANADGWQRAAGRFDIPANCPGQVIAVSIPQAGGRPFSIWIDDVSIRSSNVPDA